MEANYFTILYWFCHTSTWILHGCTCVPHPEPSSLLPACTIPLGHPSAPAPSILNRTWTGDSFHIWYYTCFNAIPPNHPTLSSPTEYKRLFYTSVPLLLSRIQGYCYHHSKFHIYALVYCIDVFLSGVSSLRLLTLHCLFHYSPNMTNEFLLPKNTRIF